MAAPALRIPVALDLDSLRQQTERASSQVGATLRTMGSQFLKLNNEIGAQSAASGALFARNIGGGLTSALTKLVAVRLAIGAFALTAAAAIGEARRQLEEMVDVAEKAGSANVSAEFFQKFTKSAQNLKIEAKDLEDALTNAFQSTKDKLDQLNPTLAKLQEFFLAGFFKDGDKREGIELFRNAQNQDEKIRAILVSMTELNLIGERLASLDLAERVFGTNLADNIRRGTTSAEELLATIDKMQLGGLFSNAQVQQADEIDKKLKIASNTLDQNLRPAWEGLTDVALNIKNVWADIVGLIARAASLFQGLDTISLKRDELASVTKAIEGGTGLFGIPQFESGRIKLLERQKRLMQEIAAAETAPLNAETFNSRFLGDVPPGIPLPRSRPSDAPKPVETAATRSPFDRAADSVERRTAGLEAETQNIDLNTQARERAKVMAELQTIAMQANAAAGLGENVITAEQQLRIDAVAEAYGRAALAAENARSPLREFARDAANVNRQLQEAAVSGLQSLEDGLLGIINGTKAASQAFKEMAQSILNDLARIAIRQAITGPIAGALGGFLGLPGRAGGGPVSGGSAYVVGERGPEIFVPNTSGSIVPNSLASRTDTGGINVVVHSRPVFQAGMTPTDMASIEARMAQNDQMLRGQIVQDIRGGLSNDSSYLGRGG